MPANFVCSDCKKDFFYAATLTQNVLASDDRVKSVASTEEITVFDTVELKVCPFCHSSNLTEVLLQEIVKTADLEDMIFVEFSAVKDCITKGYVELDRKDHVYAKGLVMIKLKTESAPLARRDLKTENVQLDKSTAELRSDRQGFMMEAPQ